MSAVHRVQTVGIALLTSFVAPEESLSNDDIVFFSILLKAVAFFDANRVVFRTLLTGGLAFSILSSEATVHDH